MTKTILQPIEDKLLIKKIELPDRTAHGVILPDIAKEEALIGEVIAVGRGRMTFDGHFVKNECEVGDKVYYLKFEAYKVEVDDEEFVVIRESTVLARMKQEIQLDEACKSK